MLVAVHRSSAAGDDAYRTARMLMDEISSMRRLREGAAGAAGL